MQKFRLYLAFTVMLIAACFMGWGSVHLGFTVGAATGSVILGVIAWAVPFFLWFYYLLSGGFDKRFKQIAGTSTALV